MIYKQHFQVRKNYLIILMLLVTVSIIICSFIISPPSGSTNAPGEKSCADEGWCHTGTPNTGPGFAEIIIKYDETATCYIPGQVYTIVPYTMDTDTGKTIIGFQTVALLDNENGAGIVTLIDPSKTNLDIPPIPGDREYIGHTQAGTANPAKYDWEYSWTAPIAGSGTVYIYGAFVAGQGDIITYNDDVYTDTLILYECSTGIFSQPHTSQDLMIERIFPVPASDFVNIDIRTAKTTSISISIIDMNGKVVFTEPTFQVNSTKYCYKLNVSALTEGIYFVNVKQYDKAGIIQRIIKI
ncbi:MAG: choice-of-anchor V domain-containing protein [Bacteroidota bacterium]